MLSVLPNHILVQPCPFCAVSLDVSDYEPLQEIVCPQCAAGIRVQRSYHQFELVEVLGQGGMGTVYEAWDTSLNRAVAFKLLQRDFCSDRRSLAKLEKEARITGSIHHPNIVQIYSSGQDHGQFYMVMELILNGTLDDLLERSGRVEEAKVLEIGIEVARGLLAVHQVGLVHRDVKPANILFAQDQSAKISDFGLAVLANRALAQGEIWGTPYYIAPEKLCKLPEDHRSDIYSLGATLFHALAGRPPYEAEDSTSVALKHLKARAVSLQAFAPDVSEGTAFVINRMMDKDPEKRYQSYEELIEHLRYALECLQAHGLERKKQRVIVETVEQQAFWGFATGAMLLLAIALAATLFIFRDRLFNRSEATVARAALTQPSVPHPPAAGSLPSPVAIVLPLEEATRLVAPKQAENGFLNSSFEEPNIDAFTYSSDGSSWTFANNAGLQRNNSAYSGEDTVAPDGVATAFVQSGNGTLGTLSQTLDLPAGIYNIRFQAAARWSGGQPIQVSVDGVPVGICKPADNHFEAMTAGPFEVATGRHTIAFSATDGSGDKTSFIDMVSLSRSETGNLTSR